MGKSALLREIAGRVGAPVHFGATAPHPSAAGDRVVWDIPPASTPDALPEAFTSGDGRIVIAKRREADLPGLARALAYGRAFIFGASDLVLGETEIAAVALVRELREELGLVVDPSLPIYLGRFTAPAANEPGVAVEAELFRVAIADDVTPLAEIEEAIWIHPNAADNLMLAPLTRHHVLPLARSFHGTA